MRYRQQKVLLGLVSAGVLAPESLFDPATQIEDTSRLNASFCVRTQHGRAMFVKHASQQALYARISAEAATVRRLGRQGVLSRHLPTPIFESPQIRAVAYALIPGRNLLAAAVADVAVPSGASFLLGRLVADLHAAPTNAVETERNILLEVASLLAPHGPAHGTQSPSQLRIVRLVHESSPLLEACARTLERSVSDLVPVHGDLRWDNIMTVAASRDDLARDGLQLVDWEFFALAPREWDLASLTASAFFTWLGSIQVGEADGEHQLILHYTLSMACAFAREVLRGYGWKSTEQSWSSLSDCLVLRIVQLAYGTEGNRYKLRASTVLSLQFAENVARTEGSLLRSLVEGRAC